MKNVGQVEKRKQETQMQPKKSNGKQWKTTEGNKTTQITARIRTRTTTTRKNTKQHKQNKTKNE